MMVHGGVHKHKPSYSPVQDYLQGSTRLEFRNPGNDESSVGQAEIPSGEMGRGTVYAAVNSNQNP